MTNLRRLALILFLFAAVFVATAAETNFTCVVCGKTPLTGRVWMSKWGAVCDDCYQLENHCSLCGLPIRDGDGAVKTGDGRFICRFDKREAILDAAAAREIFTDTRRELIELFGRSFALNFPEVKVDLFDVDYWSEKGRDDGLHKFGFSSTRKSASGVCTHEVVLLSGRRRTELAATAAHEYTHLWINENRPPEHAIGADTVEAICELAAYKLMQARKESARQKEILENPYTHGEIKKLVALEEMQGFGFVLNWVKNGATPSLAESAAAPPAKAAAGTNALPQPPAQLRFTGLSVIGKDEQAIISGVSFAPGKQRRVTLRNRTVLVRCCEIRADEVIVQINDGTDLVKLKLSGEN
jgi:hypothetical protein